MTNLTLRAQILLVVVVLGLIGVAVRLGFWLGPRLDFAYPWVLGFLVIPLVVLAWVWRRPGQRRAAVRPWPQRTGGMWAVLLNSAESSRRSCWRS
jgi:hypothetical protein